MVPHGRRRAEGDAGHVRQVAPVLQEGVGQTTPGLVHPHDVGAGRVGGAVQVEGLGRLLHLDVVEQQEVHQPGGLLRALLQRFVGPGTTVAELLDPEP